MFFPRHGLTLCLVAALLVGCATGKKMSNIRPDLHKSDVVRILGQHDGLGTVENHEVVRYSNRATSGWSWDRADYNVVFLNGRVVEYGAGEVRPGPRPHTVFIHRF